MLHMLLILNPSVSIHALLAECDLTVNDLRFCHTVSIHALLAECDLSTRPATLKQSWFQSTHSLRSATKKLVDNLARNDVSIHALLAECDCKTAKLSHGRFTFQSTHSLRSATSISLSIFPDMSSFNPRTPCGVRQRNCVPVPRNPRFQSTHSLRSATLRETLKKGTI